MIIKPKVAILITDGTNCDQETFFAFQLAEARPAKVHINQLINKKDSLSNYQMLVIPGGFTYGDDVLSGKILANQLLYRLGKKINKFIAEKKLIIGICNGFQVLVRMGLLPWKMSPAEDCSLIFNNSGHLECRWIKLIIKKTNCIFTQGMEGKIIELPVAHGEGKFIIKNDDVLEKIKKEGLIVCQYVDEKGNPTMDYPANPNGAIEAIAGVCDKTGRIFGLMPHPERYILKTQYPDWRRQKQKNSISHGLPFFKNAVEYFKKNL